MKYILPIILLIFIGCQKNETKKTNLIESNISKTSCNNQIEKGKEKSVDKIIIKVNDIHLTFFKNKLIYPKKKIILLFCDDSPFSKAQKDVLNQLKVKYETVNNKYLENYFHIKIYPTIIVLDKNKTIKYENFVPYEILKTEGF